jgi:Uma2 family endonuclease
MVALNQNQSLPTSAELPCSDDTPVDNEDQNLLPNYLLFLLQRIWRDRTDWYFGVDMGIYHTTGASPKVPVVPDGFLSLGVPRRKPDNQSRCSYVLWEENNIPPILVLEMVSLTPGGEYDEKLAIYARLGVLYYVIYNPEFWQRDRHLPFEVYQLIDGEYVLQIGEPFWFPELGLALGRCRGQFGGIEREMLSWFDQRRDRYLSAEEQADLETQRADRAEQSQREAIPRLAAMGLTAEQIAAALALPVEVVTAALS